MLSGREALLTADTAPRHGSSSASSSSCCITAGSGSAGGNSTGKQLTQLGVCRCKESKSDIEAAGGNSTGKQLTQLGVSLA